eukprot:3507420-Lingulodinium_polyedra.AAC.1
MPAPRRRQRPMPTSVNLREPRKRGRPHRWPRRPAARSLLPAQQLPRRPRRKGKGRKGKGKRQRPEEEPRKGGKR